MNRKSGFRMVMVAVVVVAMFVQVAGCGYFMHPERRGQSKGKVDAGIAVLDGIGLLFFLIPGIVAFAVDFSHNTIYLPADKSSLNGPEKDELISLKIPRDQFTEKEIERIVSQHYGFEVDMDSPDVEVYEADNIDEIKGRMTF
jgi:hypothetical protein